ncbi:MAG: YhbY family RNA-binding protein [Candidatus Bathyarchaeota archaeon]|nr:YhbY family RNA-binding protein [Candidatus Bathyarchaeota archaeon]
MQKKASTIKTKIWIGKEGITSTFIEQLNNQLKTNKLVKVKIQKNILENEQIEEIAQKTAKDTNSNLIDIRGRTFSLFKPSD